MSGFSRALAVGIMEAWKAGASMKRLSDDLLKELDEKVREGAYVHEMDARTFTATFSRYANECLWDGRFNSAINWLIKHGAERPNTQYKNSGKRSAQYFEKRGEADKRAVDALYDAHRRSAQWGVCK